MTLHELHAERRRILNDIRWAEMARQYELAAHLLDKFQRINHQIRDADEGYHQEDIRHDMAMQIN